MAAQYVDWEHLRTYSEGDRTFEEQVIAAFFQQALMREDFVAVAKGIHQMRGAAGNLGTYLLYELLVKCEQAVTQSNIHDCWCLFREAKQVLAETIAECNRMGFYGNEVH
jgi:HPt (histidine-containing phosphotransfer) domain-containing protein